MVCTLNVTALRRRMPNLGRSNQPELASSLQASRFICSEESYCRFCKRRLPDWKARLTPANVVPSRTAVMVRTT